MEKTNKKRGSCAIHVALEKNTFNQTSNTNNTRLWGDFAPYITKKNKMRTNFRDKSQKIRVIFGQICLTFTPKHDSIAL